MEGRALSAARLTRRRLATGLAVTAVGAVAAIALGLAIGSVGLDPAAIVAGTGTDRLIFVQLRIPRVLLAAVVGAGLAASGAALQPTLRNPLASPDIIGVSGGAALAAVAALALLPAGAAGGTLVPVVAFAGAVISSAIVYRLALVRGRLDPYTQVLVGVIFNTFVASIILLISAVVDLSRSHSIVFWLMGGIAVQPYPVLALVTALVAIGAGLLIRETRSLNLLALGDDAAEHLGVDLTATRRRVFAASSLLVGAVVSLTGIITFVGLIVPHVLRRLLGSDNRLLVPASAFGGATFLVSCDALARWIVAPAELPVGAITAMAGGPFFIYLLCEQPAARPGRTRNGREPFRRSACAVGSDRRPAKRAFRLRRRRDPHAWVRPRGPARRDDGGARTQRVGQDHPTEADGRIAGSGRRQRSRLRGGARAGTTPRLRAARGRGGPAEHFGLSFHGAGGRSHGTGAACRGLPPRVLR
jgi:iron complex transport system permease protein